MDKLKYHRMMMSNLKKVDSIRNFELDSMACAITMNIVEDVLLPEEISKLIYCRNYNGKYFEFETLLNNFQITLGRHLR